MVKPKDHCWLQSNKKQRHRAFVSIRIGEATFSRNNEKFTPLPLSYGKRINGTVSLSWDIFLGLLVLSNIVKIR